MTWPPLRAAPCRPPVCPTPQQASQALGAVPVASVDPVVGFLANWWALLQANSHHTSGTHLQSRRKVRGKPYPLQPSVDLTGRQLGHPAAQRTPAGVSG